MKTRLLVSVFLGVVVSICMLLMLQPTSSTVQLWAIDITVVFGALMSLRSLYTVHKHRKNDLGRAYMWMMGAAFFLMMANIGWSAREGARSHGVTKTAIVQLQR